MDKIKDLLAKSGCKQELVDSICEALEQYKGTLSEKLEADYLCKVEKAKKICIEETEAHKRELARRVQIFCESKVAAIESHIAKNSALSESKAMTKLRSIQEALNGVSNGVQNGDVEAALKKANKQVRIANEEKKKAIEIANKQTSIAERTLKQYKKVVAENSELKRRAQTVVEHKTKLDNRSKQSKPVTTREVLVENQISQGQATASRVEKPVSQIASIAEQID